MLPREPLGLFPASSCGRVDLYLWVVAAREDESLKADFRRGEDAEF